MLVAAYTQTLIDRIMTRSVHGIVLTGRSGAGKGHAARLIAQQKLGLSSAHELEIHPYLKIITPENNSIGIEQIRDLQRFLQLKTIGTHAIQRVAILEDAHTMTNEAQNALLKSLEEPPADTVILLTAPATRQLKETIYSRIQRLPILPITKAQALEYFSADFGASTIEKAFAISGGRAGLLYALLHTEAHPLITEIQRAKEILAGDTFTRLARVDELSKQREAIPLFLQACKLIASTALHQAAAKTSPSAIKRWHHTLKTIYDAEAALPRNPNSKLLLTDLFLHL